MYLPVYVYDCVAGKKKSILSLYIFFSQTSPSSLFTGPKADGQCSGLEFPLLCAGNQEEPQPQWAVGLAEAGTGRHLSSLLASQATSTSEGGDRLNMRPVIQAEGWLAGREAEAAPACASTLHQANAASHRGGTDLSPTSLLCCRLLCEAFLIAQKKQNSIC